MDWKIKRRKQKDYAPLIKVALGLLMVVIFTITGLLVQDRKLVGIGLLICVGLCFGWIIRLQQRLHLLQNLLTEQNDAEDLENAIHKTVMQRNELAALGESRGQIALRLGYRLRGPANEINSCCKRLLNRSQENDRKILTKLQMQAYVLNQTIEDTVTLMELSMGKKKSVATNVNILKVIKECVGAVGEKDRIKIETDNKGSEITTNYAQLRAIIMEGLTNSIKADGSGEIQISLQRQDQKAIIRILDKGPGLPKEILPKVFQPFAHKKGGMGLAIAYLRAEAINAELEVHNLEIGSEYRISIPVNGRSPEWDRR